LAVAWIIWITGPWRRRFTDGANTYEPFCLGSSVGHGKRFENNNNRGYQLLRWADSGLNYWAVSDVNANDLQLFEQQFETRTLHH